MEDKGLPFRSTEAVITLRRKKRAGKKEGRSRMEIEEGIVRVQQALYTVVARSLMCREIGQCSLQKWVAHVYAGLD